MSATSPVATWSSIPIGITESGETVSQDLRLSPHMVIYGATMSGKTVALRASAQERLARGHELVAIGFNIVDAFPHDPLDAEQTLRDVLAVVAHRIGILGREDAVSWDALSEEVRNAERIHPLSVLVDGLETFEPAVERLVKRIVAMARPAGVFVLVTTQRPTSAAASHAFDTVIQCTRPGRIPSDLALSLAFGPGADDAHAALRGLDDGHTRGLAVVSGGVAHDDRSVAVRIPYESASL